MSVCRGGGEGQCVEEVGRVNLTCDVIGEGVTKTGAQVRGWREEAHLYRDEGEGHEGRRTGEGARNPSGRLEGEIEPEQRARGES